MTRPRMTKQRAALQDLLRVSDEFRSAQGWHDALRVEGEGMGLATVYRTLQALADAGEVDSVVTESGETLYRRCEAGESHHHHLRCRSCGRAQDIDVPEFEEWAAGAAAAHGYTNVEHTVELIGLCSDCTARDAH